MESENRRLHERRPYPDGVDGVSARYVELRSGLRVRVVEAGEQGAPPIVLLPGWGCGAWVFHENLLPLAACGFRATAVELKGHGLSDKPTSKGEYTVESMRDHVIDVLDALGLDSTGLVGHSMGAAIAAHVAAAHPERIASLVMSAPVGFAGVKGMWLFRLLTPAFALPVMPFIATRAFIRGLLSVVYGSRRKASLDDIEEFYAPTRYPGFLGALRSLLHDFNWTAAFPVLSMPWMTILGSEDILSPASQADRYAGSAAAREVLVIEGAGHVIFDEAPEIVNAALCQFFSRHAAPYISSTNDKNH
jgi:pimeloyl-ACP methyl ester carboxylesterase